MRQFIATFLCHVAISNCQYSADGVFGHLDGIVWKHWYDEGLINSKSNFMITYFLGLPTGCCVFPFTYRGVNYNHCTTDGGHPSHWCATELNDDGSMKRWQNCDQNCYG